jgi:hypothetical protein
VAAAAQTNFCAALGRIGINVATRTAIAKNGFATILDLESVQDKDLDKLPKHLEAWKVPAAPPNAQVRIPFVSLTKLKAMRYWVLSPCCVVGVDEPRAQDFTDKVMTEVLAQMKADKDYRKATQDTDIQKPPKLNDLVKWIKFWELFTTYLGRMKGAALTPLTYLLRTADYDSTQERLIATTALSGAHCKQLNNLTLYNEFKPLVVDGPGWSFVKKFDRAKNGRGAVLALKMQTEGTSAKLTRKQTAYASIASSAYLGPRKGFTFASNVTLHQAAHDELMDLDEPVSESKKVTDFLKGIRDPVLNTGKSIVLGDPGKLGNFEECQQYLSTIVQHMAAQSKSERNVSSISTYTDEQYRSLSDHNKKRVQTLREEARNKKKDKCKSRREKRKLAKAKSEREQGSDATAPTTGTSGTSSSSAGSQFGSNSVKNKKEKA